jgi:ubiquinone/menaquinone biosynthesis C-methylase UbiE
MTDFDTRARTWDDDPVRVDRARTVADCIAQMVPLDEMMYCLEYGAGTGLLSFALQARVGGMVLADTSKGMLEVADEKIVAAGLDEDLRVMQLDLLKDPMPEDRFDLLVTLLTLHHIPDIPGILGKFHDILASPGWLCIADLDREDGSFHGSGFEGHRGFDREELRRLVEQAGFANVRFDTAYNMPRKIDGVERLFTIFLLVAKKKEA